MGLQTKRKLTINKITDFKRPDYIWLALRCGNDTNITLIPRIGEQVYKGSVAGNTKGASKTFIHSPVSGKVVGIENKIYPNGDEVKCLIIENDFKEILAEFKPVNEDITDYTMEEFIDVIKNAGIVDASGPVYLKFDTDNRFKTLIVDASEDEPYLTADYMLIKTKIKEILDSIDAIMEINRIDNGIIAIAKDDKKLLHIINQYIGTYVNIKVTTVYPEGKNSITLNVDTVHSIHRALKNGFPVVDKIITLSGEQIKKPTNISVKIGTPIKDILEAFEVKEGPVVLVASGPLTGYSLERVDSMITKDLNAILALPALKREETPCIRCGKCIEECPVAIAPICIKNTIYNIRKLEALHPERCINCGMCSYICPARIDLRISVVEGALRVKEASQDETN